MDFLKTRVHCAAVTALLILSASSCRDEAEIYRPDENQTGTAQRIPLTGFYLLNEGNMGSNKASLDRYTFADAIYSRNIYADANPDVPKELGDVGNDLAVYGSRLWAVINCSNKVEVLDLKTARRIGQVDIPNCRYIAFDGPYAYVTSYAGPVEINPDYRQRGFVARIDTLTLQETARTTVGYQPDGIAISNGKIYVANSGGYMVPNYENTVSVIDAATMEFEKNIEIAINLDKIAAAPDGRLWVSSRGDYFDTPSLLFVCDPASGETVRTFDSPVSSMWLDGDSLYTVSSSFNYYTGNTEHSFAVFNTRTLEKECDNFITDGSGSKIKTPYGVAVNPVTKEIYVCDATTYVNPGMLYCFSPDGKLKWSQRTGDIPAKIAFY